MLNRRLNSRKKTRERGASLITFTLVCVMVLIPMMGLAIDGAINFWVKAKLSNAVDAAALAAGRNPTANATTTALQYIYANFPAGWLGTSFPSAPTAVATFPYPGTRTVTVTATVTVPLHFMTILGVKTDTVAAAAVSSRRNTNVMLVLDRSGSMNQIGADGATDCATMKAAATTFVNYFVEGQDQVGLISFHTWANVDYSFSTTFQTNLASILSDLTCGSNTSSAMALNMAYNQITALGSAAYAANGYLNVIVFFTDGQPNGLTAIYPAKGATDSRYYADVDNNDTAVLDSSMPATASQCISSLPLAASAGVLIQGSNSAPTGLTQGLYQNPATPTGAPTAVCASGNSRAVCNTVLTVNPVAGCYFSTNPWSRPSPYPNTGPDAVRQDVAYIPLKDSYNDSTSNLLYTTQSSDLVTGTYAGSNRMRIDTPQSVTDASFNAADAQALTIISDTTYKPVIYTIGLGGATDNPSAATFQTFLQRVANDPSSNRFNANLPIGLFVYSADDTQLAAAFHQIASQILRLSK